MKHTRLLALALVAVSTSMITTGCDLDTLTRAAGIGDVCSDPDGCEPPPPPPPPEPPPFAVQRR